MVTPRVLAILRCPVCRAGPLVVQDTLVCLGCGQRYRIVDGVPVMVAGGEADVVPSTVGSEGVPRTVIGRAARWLRMTFSPPSVVYITGGSKIVDFISSLGERAIIVDIGSGSKRRGKDVISLDMFLLPGVDVVFDGREVPIKDAAVDGIISTAVLEHVRDPSQLVSEMFRISGLSGSSALARSPSSSAFSRFPISSP